MQRSFPVFVSPRVSLTHIDNCQEKVQIGVLVATGVATDRPEMAESQIELLFLQVIGPQDQGNKRARAEYSLEIAAVEPSVLLARENCPHQSPVSHRLGV